MGTVESLSAIAQGTEFYRQPAVAEAYSARPDYPSEAIHYVRDTMARYGFVGNRRLRILDAGCGTGQLTEALIDGFAGAEIFAMDQSEAMVSALSADITARAIPVIDSFDETDFPDNYFDLVTFGTAMHWGDSGRLPQELYRLLRPGGFVASVSNVTRQGTAFSNILDTLPSQAAKLNFMTADPKRIELGSNFTFLGFDDFTNDVYRTPEDFYRLLASIELLSAITSESRADAMQKMKEYAQDKDNLVGGLIAVPFDTYVRIAKAKSTGVGVLACRSETKFKVL